VDLPVERFERILDQLPMLEEIKLMGVGEPLLNPQFFDLVRCAKRRHIRVWTITNGTTLDLQEHRREIISCGLERLEVSIDSVNPQVHARWRGGSDLGEIVDGLRRLVELRGRSRRPQLKIWTVGNPDNLAELPALVSCAADIGLDGLTYASQMSSWGKDDVYARLEGCRLDPQSVDLARYLNEARGQSRKRNLAFRVWSVEQCNAERPCSWPWGSCMITAEGYVTRCAIASDPRLHNFGTVHETPFKTIWNSPEYQEFRRAHRDHKVPAICRWCYGLEKQHRIESEGGSTGANCERGAACLSQSATAAEVRNNFMSAGSC